MKTSLILATVLLSTAANAEFLTGNDLLQRQTSSSVYDNGVAVGYVMASFDAGLGTNHCPPTGVTLGQVSDMIKQALIGAPSARHLPADSIAYYVLNKQWPCPKKNNGGTAL